MANITPEKKAWNKLKRELRKNGDPLQMAGRMYMSAAQERNRTATIFLGNLSMHTKEELDEYAHRITRTAAWIEFIKTIGVTDVKYEHKREQAWQKGNLYLRIYY